MGCVVFSCDFVFVEKELYSVVYAACDEGRDRGGVGYVLYGALVTYRTEQTGKLVYM